MNFILEGSLKQTVLYTCSTILNFILEGKLCFTETKRLCRITLIVYISRKEDKLEKLKFIVYSISPHKTKMLLLPRISQSAHRKYKGSMILIPNSKKPKFSEMTMLNNLNYR